MLTGFKDTLEEIINTLSEHGLVANVTDREGRFFLNIEEMMCDPGFGCDNVVLDIFFDEHERVLFIGLLRFPSNKRKEGIGSIIVEKIKDYAREHHFFIYLDAWNESQPFWKKHEFSHVYFDFNFFEIMGWSPDGLDVKEEWETHKRDQTGLWKFVMDEHPPRKV
ncbi:GNAT family N-acetyltransferase [Bacillus solimangrovi]|uniref:GNAT family N-acetyltransferase n=1 Tax=Bacillus solimangrovi TaxID=1305675 RepID=A0A1E5LF77_9BACI|nr:GNAT family N-acetyltransferase [Bacillus solimangrovi]OEH92722.1 GNAT family N-acetyltransferase [Bacillus solimangrovi]